MVPGSDNLVLVAGPLILIQFNGTSPRKSCIQNQIDIDSPATITRLPDTNRLDMISRIWIVYMALVFVLKAKTLENHAAPRKVADALATFPYRP